MMKIIFLISIKFVYFHYQFKISCVLFYNKLTKIITHFLCDKKMIKDAVRDKEEFNNPQDLIKASISGKKPDLMVDKKKEK